MSALTHADLLRKAGRRLRKRASKATEGTWAVAHDSLLVSDLTRTGPRDIEYQYAIADLGTDSARLTDVDDRVDNPATPRGDARYMAMMQPATARLLSGLLDIIASAMEHDEPTELVGGVMVDGTGAERYEWSAAVELARAVLRKDGAR